MPYKDYTQTGFRIFISTLDELRFKLGRFFKFLLACLLVFSLLSFVIGFIVASDLVIDASLFEYMGIGSSLMLADLPIPDLGNLSDSLEFSKPVEAFSRILGLVLTGLFAGFSVSVLSKPMNCILFADHAVIDLERSRFRIRYWIRQPEDKYLYGASLELRITTKAVSTLGTTGAQDLTFVYREPPFSDKNPTGKYFGIRGVRYFDIELSRKSVTDFNLTLKETIRSAFEADAEADKNEQITEVFARISGVDSEGRTVYRDHKYKLDTILCGYNFLSIRADEIMKKREDLGLKEPSDIDNREYVLFHEHFNIVYPQKERSLDNPFDDLKRLSCNIPPSCYRSDNIKCKRWTLPQAVQRNLFMLSKEENLLGHIIRKAQSLRPKQ